MQEPAFWAWFVKEQQTLLDADHASAEIFYELTLHLAEVDGDLTFELGPKVLPREFVISADGLRSSFPSVVSLVQAAPPLPQWHIVAFRPRRPFAPTVEMNGYKVDPATVQFSLVDNGKQAGIYLFIPGYLDNADGVTLKDIGYLLLDDQLGEYDVETKVGLVRMFPPESAIPYDRYALPELPRLFDQLTARLEGLSGLTTRHLRIAR